MKTVVEDRVPEGFRSLLDGEGSAGWHGAISPAAPGEVYRAGDFLRHWTVEDGEMINDGGGPFAVTDDDVGDIELLIEFKASPMADSGVYLRGTSQVKVWDWNQPFDPRQPDRKAFFGSGGLFDNTPGTLGRNSIRWQDNAIGQWNQLRIIQIGARTWVWLNAAPIVHGAVMENARDRSQPLPAAGPIMLAPGGSEVRWQNIFIRDIGAEEAKQFLENNPPLPEPTLYDVPYGPHHKQLIHFWKATSDTPTPLLFHIHGGGWTRGGRLSGLEAMLTPLLEAGISVVSVEYRFIAEATADGVIPPVKGPLHDAARALQFVRSRADEWNINRARVGASGGSAGACSSLWLAFHPDMADATSEDPIARESTRLWCAAVDGAQTTLDPKQMKEWTPNSTYGGHAFGFTADPDRKRSQFDAFLAGRDAILAWIAEYSPYALVTRGDPPIYLRYGAAPALGEAQIDPTHTANFGVKLQEHCRQNGVDCELFYPGVDAGTHQSIISYLISTLTAP